MPMHTSVVIVYKMFQQFIGVQATFYLSLCACSQTLAAFLTVDPLLRGLFLDIALSHSHLLSLEFMRLVKLLQSICAVHLIRFQHFLPLHRHSFVYMVSLLFFFFHLTFTLLPRLRFNIRVVSLMHHFIKDFYVSISMPMHIYVRLCVHAFMRAIACAACTAYTLMCI